MKNEKWVKGLLLFIWFTLFTHATMYENAELGTTTNWEVYDNTPSGATINNIVDEEKGKVISFLGSGTDNGYRMGNFHGLANAWNNSQEKILKWSMKYSEDFLIFISLNTQKGHKFLTYSYVSYNTGYGYGLGASSKDGTWHSFTRDLEADLHNIDPTNEIITVDGFFIRGTGLIDDVELVNSAKANKLNKIKTLINAALDGTKNPIYMIAGDSHRDAAYALSQTIYHRELKEFNIDYWHTAASAITSPIWMEGKDGDSSSSSKYKIFISKVRGDEGEDTILEFELGNNDWKYLLSENKEERENNLTEELKKDINTILERFPKLNIFLVASTKHDRNISKSLQRVYQRISDDLELPLMIEPTDDIYFSEYGYGTPTNEIQFSADGAHPTYLGALKVLYGTLKYITDSTRSDVQDKLSTQSDNGESSVTWNSSLYGDTSEYTGENLAQGVNVENKLRIFDGHYSENSIYRGMKIPVIGGSIVKIKHPGNMTSIKLMINDESYLHGLGFEYDEIGTTASTVSLKKGVRVDTDPYHVNNVYYKFIYIPIGCESIYINISQNESDIDTNLSNNPVEVYYATSEEMNDWHPDIGNVTKLSDRLFK